MEQRAKIALAHALTIAATALAIAMGTACGAMAQIKQVRVYGNSAQFVLSTMTQLQAGNAMLSNHTRIKIRFQETGYSRWQLMVHSTDTYLSINGGSGSITDIPIGNLQLQAVAGPSAAINTNLTPATVAISATPAQLASGTVDDPNLVAEAEILVTYTLTGPFTVYNEGIYWANVKFLLEEY